MKAQLYSYTLSRCMYFRFVVYICFVVTLLLMTVATAVSDDSFDSYKKRDSQAWQKFIDSQQPETGSATAPVKAGEQKQAQDKAETATVDEQPIDLDALANPALAAVLPTLPTIKAWLPPAAVTNNAKYAIPEDPCVGLDLKPDNEELPPEPPEDLLSTSLARNINTLTKSRYRAVVTAAHEAMRLIMGQMPTERAQVFEMRWMALYDFPSAKVVNYLDRLNPLLVEFLALRQSTEVLMMDMGNLRFEAEMAAAYDDEDATRSAMDQVGLAVEALKTVKRRLNGVAAAVAALGDPPNPREEKCRTRRRFKEMLSPPGTTNGAWVLTSVAYTNTWKRKDYRITTNSIKFAATRALTYSFVPAKYISADNKWPACIISWGFSWTPAPRMLRPNEPPPFSCLMEDAGVTYGDGRAGTKIWLRSTNHVADTVVFNGMISTWAPEKKFNGVYNTLLAELRGKVGGIKRLTPQQLAEKPPPTVDFVPKAQTVSWKQKLLPGKAGWVAYIDVAVNSADNAGRVRYTYTYDPNMPPPPPQASTPTSPGAGITDNAAAEAAKLKLEKLDFYKGQIKLIEEDIKRYKKMLSEIKPGSNEKQVTALRWLLRAKRDDLQREHDQITKLMTGKFVRTRTKYDEMIAMQLRANAGKLATDIHRKRHRRRTISRLVDLMPKDKRPALRYWVRKTLRESSAPDKEHAVAEALTEKVQAYYTGQAQDHMADADAYQQTIDTLHNYQVPATYVMYATPFVAGGPALALAYGVTSGGIDGYFSGGILGPDHKGAVGATVGGVVTSARFLSAKIDYAITFYEGYTQPDAQGQQGGILGGLKRVAVTFVKRKAVEKVTRYGLECQARIKAQNKQAGMDIWRDIKREHEFKRMRRIGKERVKSHQAAYKRYKQLKESGASPMALKIARQKLMDKTIAIMHSPHAKGYLKFNATKAEQYAYNATSRLQVNRLVKELRVELKQQGFDTDQLHFKTIRNAGNTTPGMDADIGMTSTFADGKQIYRIDPATGKPAHLDLYRGGQTVQSIFNSVYRRNSGGRDSSEAWVQITTTDSLEAYRDPNWVYTGKRFREGLDPSFGIDPNHAADAARVTEQKLYEIQHGYHPESTKFWEQCRGTAKDINTKVIPLLSHKIEQTSVPKQRKQLLDRLDFYTDLSNALKLANHDPVAAEQAIKHLTGFEPVEAMKMSTIGIEALGKW